MGNWLFGTKESKNSQTIKLDKQIFWVRHAESCANIGGIMEKLEQPSLTRHGIVQAILLGTEFVNKKHPPFEFAYSSASARTIMTALLSTRSYISLRHIIIDPYIGELVNIGDVFSYDYQNKIMAPKKLRLMVQYIKNWLKDEWLVGYDDPEFINCLVKLKDKIRVEDNKFKTQITNFLITQCTHETKETFIQFIKSMLKIEYYKNLPEAKCINKFLDQDFLKGKPIYFKNLDKLYNDAKTNYNKNNRFSNFYSNKHFRVAICFCHGAVLKDYFENKFEQQWKKLNRQNILPLDSHMKLTNTAVILENFEGIHPVYHYTDSIMKPPEETNEGFCFNEGSFNRNINILGKMNDDLSPLSEMEKALVRKFSGLDNLADLYETPEITNKYLKTKKSKLI